MRRFLKKIVLSFLLGTFFVLGGFEVARAENAGANAVANANSGAAAIMSTAATSGYYFRFHNKNVSPIVYQISSAYTTLSECTAQQDAKTGTNGNGSVTGFQLDSACALSSTLTQQQSAVAQQQAGDVINAGDDTTSFLIKSFSCKSFGSCIASLLLAGPAVILYVIYKIASLLLTSCGYLFDWMLSWSISGPLINPTPAFIDSSWTTVRDFSNMLFIFILIYTGVQTILGMGKWAKTVLYVIVMALLINFSLFFTKVVIDAGNIIAVGIKSSIGPGGGSGIASNLVAAFRPQAFLSTAGDGITSAMIVFVIAIIINGFAAYIFFKAAILFARRLVVFWGLMILSPFAFISMALPGSANKFESWLNELTHQTFVAPIFLFFIYIIMQVINAPAPTGGKLLDLVSVPGTSWFTKILGPAIIAALIIKALQESLKFAEDFAGKAGGEFSGLVAGAMGLGVTGAAMAGTGGVAALGAIGSKFGGKGGVLGSIGDVAAKTSHAARDFTFDPRNIPIPLVGGTVGSHTGAGAGRTSTYESKKDEAVKKAEEKAKRDAQKPESVAEAVAKAGKKREEKEKKKNDRKKALEDKRRDLDREIKRIESEKQTGINHEDKLHEAEAELKAAEKEIDLAEQLGDNTKRQAANARFVSARRAKTKAEKDFKLAENGNEEIAKIDKELKDLSE